MKTNNNVQIDESNRAALEYLTSEIKLRLNSVDKHKSRFFENGKSAGIMLIDLKSKLPHGSFTPWLMANEISATTAQRWMREATDPEAATQRRNEQLIRDRETRAAKQEWEEFKSKTTTHGGFEETPKPAAVKSSGKPKQESAGKSLVPATQLTLIRLVKQLTEEQQANLIQLIESNQL
jgi:hypothetical protein